MHYLVTGHTGFKGAWLALMLKNRGHTVSGLALDPIPGALFELASVASDLAADWRVDIRNAAETKEAIAATRPDVVMHLAAQPIVRESYRDPRFTIETNVMGTLNVLDAVAAAGSVKALVVITTDKVYRNVRQTAGYVETDALGGQDPYSASKAMADILTDSWTRSFVGVPTAVARAGNVIGGGDVASDRLMPDLLSAYAAGTPATLRYPKAVRPWQHVLDCLNGYLILADAVLAGHGSGAWNFGPDEDSFVTVGEVASVVAEMWGEGASWVASKDLHPHEAELLALDATKARVTLGWRSHLGFQDALRWTVDWHRQARKGGARAATQSQIDAFEQFLEIGNPGVRSPESLGGVKACGN